MDYACLKNIILNLPQDTLKGLTVQIEYFDHLLSWLVQNRKHQKYTAAITIFISTI